MEGLQSARSPVGWCLDLLPGLVSPRHDSCQALESEDLRPISHLRLTGHMSLGGSFHVPCMSFLFFNHKMRTLASEWS